MCPAIFTRTVVVVVLVVQCVVAAPWDAYVRQTTHNVRIIGSKRARLQSYHPEPIFEAYGVEGVDHPLTKRGIAGTSEDAAKTFLGEKLGINLDSIVQKSAHASGVASYQYFNQRINGISVANAAANVAVKDNKIVSFGSSFVKPKSVAAATPKLSFNDSILIAEAATGGKYNNWPITLEYFAKDSDHVVLTYAIQVQNNRTGEWYEAFVDANSSEVVNLISFVSDARYRVIPITSQDPTDGFATLTDPYDPSSSPNGWHQYGKKTTTSTSGNNVVAYKANPDNGTTSQTSDTNNYEYDFNSKNVIDVTKDSSTVNAFYIGNMMHDLLYQYGFTETAYNFQRDNNGKGGEDNDPVLISIQDDSGINNANFVTPPDGQPGQMRMFTWTKATPPRDGALENDIVVHEYTHGLSNRLTGGGTGRCLQSLEAQGLGEGWSDAVADWTEQADAEDAVEDFTMGTYVNLRNMRDYPYSTNKIANPLTYASLRSRIEVHDAGEVWAEMWHEIYAVLIEKYGFSFNKNDSTAMTGNVIAFHLLVDGLQLQPCNPTFVAARDGTTVIQADANRYGGINRCILWATFAKRGLGSQATTSKFDDSTVPSDC